VSVVLVALVLSVVFVNGIVTVKPDLLGMSMVRRRPERMMKTMACRKRPPILGRPSEDATQDPRSPLVVL